MRFFDAGGTSLMLLRLENELAARGIDGITLTDLFRHPTITRLADRVEGADPGGRTPPTTTGRAARRERTGAGR
ncbi:acyl carrier protein [Streptomyces sp. M19]